MKSVHKMERAMERARILVVAKDPQTMSDIQNPEIANVHEIEIALNPEFAVAILSERRMDVLVLDMALTNGDDVATLKSVKEEFPSLPIIAIGDRNTKPIRTKLKRAGADFYIVRPLESDVVIKTVEGALAMAGELV